MHRCVPCGFPVRSICRDGCNGRHICRPYEPTHYIHYNIYGRERGVPRPYHAVYLCCPVGRGDLTPPESLPPWGEGGAERAG